jgi:hypothetical protein
MIPGLGVQALWPNIENVLKSFIPYIFKKNFMDDYDVHEAVYLNCEICVSWAGF